MMASTANFRAFGSLVSKRPRPSSSAFCLLQIGKGSRGRPGALNAVPTESTWSLKELGIGVEEASKEPKEVPMEMLENVASLAALDLSVLPTERVREDFSVILDWFDTIKDLTVEYDADELYSTGAPVGGSLAAPCSTPLRDDVVTSNVSVGEILLNAKRTEHDFFVVPKVKE